VSFQMYTLKRPVHMLERFLDSARLLLLQIYTYVYMCVYITCAHTQQVITGHTEQTLSSKNTQTFTQAHRQTHINTRICVCLCFHIHIHNRRSWYIRWEQSGRGVVEHTYVPPPTHTRTHTLAHTHTHVHTFMYVCMFMFSYTHTQQVIMARTMGTEWT